MAALALLSMAAGGWAALPVGVWNGSISGVPNHKLPDAPTLGNGYAGVLLADGPFDSSPTLRTVDLWLNTNANWGCTNNTAVGIPGRLTPAVCSLVGLGGVSLAVPALLDQGPASTVTFHAEQRIETGHLYTRQTSAVGSVDTLTYIHPERNVIVTNVTWSGNSATQLEIRAWVYNSTQQAHDSSASLGGLTKAEYSADCIIVTRDATRCNAECDNTIRRMRTSIAVALPAGSKRLPPSPVSNGTARTTLGGSVTLAPGSTISLVITIADNLLRNNSYDPSAAAQTLAKRSSTIEVSNAAAKFWAEFWKRSSISLPQSPEVEKYWYGALYGMATMTASSTLLSQTRGQVPPSGLYGPWVTTDQPSWNGDFTLDCA